MRAECTRALVLLAPLLFNTGGTAAGHLHCSFSPVAAGIEEMRRSYARLGYLDTVARNCQIWVLLLVAASIDEARRPYAGYRYG